MPSRINQFMQRFTLRNDRPVENDQRQPNQFGQAAARLADVQPALPVVPRPQNYDDVLVVSLENLRIRNEADSSLVTIPLGFGERPLHSLPPAEDPASDQLQGLEYLEFAKNDIRLPIGLKSFLRQAAISNPAPGRAENLIENMVEQVRMVCGQARANPEVARKLEDLANDGQLFCSDRSEYFLSQMHAVALLDRLGQAGNISYAALFNFGVANYKLEQVRLQTLRLLNEQNRPQMQSVHDLLDVEYLLQERLGLPTNHPRPTFGQVGTIRPQDAELIGDRVEASLIEKDGVRVIDYLSQWEPWVRHLADDPRFKPKYDKLTDTFHKSLEELETLRETPGTGYYDAPESTYLDSVNDQLDALRRWRTELTGQIARELLLNHRADFHCQNNQVPLALTITPAAIGRQQS